MFETYDLQKFSVSNWYPIFKEVAIQTLIFPVPQELFNEIEAGHCDVNVEEICDAEYVNQLKSALEIVRNEGFVKNNWHAPIDAKFMSLGNALKVTNLNELVLYLSASDLIIKDFALKDVPFCIALRPWMNIHPASEFRCIVINGVLRGITPRDWPTYYAHFKDEATWIISTITEFFRKNIKEKFIVSSKSYTFDVILNMDEKPLLIDFGPLSSKAKLYAFGWKELQPLLCKNCPEEMPPVFRYLTSDIGIFAPATLH